MPDKKNSHPHPAFCRYFPFAAFMVFIALEELIRFLHGFGLFELGRTTLYYLYPVKAFATGCILYMFRKNYHELKLKDLANLPASILACVTGLLVFALWIRMDWTLSSAVVPQGFDPTLLPGQATRTAMTAIRIAGAVLLVPIMEELFWRSFLIRYLIDRDFTKISVGTFSLASFLITVALFGLEHNYILAGLMAGIFYNLLLYSTRSLAQCVLSHAVTNLALAAYVVVNGEWRFW